jgi:demethylmenaquinone methyltransferase/2-methoxy-6-polyprenyl-1,4-benzoquinol methylase
VSNVYYAAGEGRADRVNALFGRIARRYDLINDLQSFGLHRSWKRRVAELARVAPGERALDLCCGTGDIAFALARRGAEVTGLDFSPQMLEVARARGQRTQDRGQGAECTTPESGIGNPKHIQVAADASPPLRQNPKPEIRTPKFIQGDAQELPFGENTFDIVTVGYGLRNLASWERGLAEMRRVARPGARLIVLDFGKPPNPLWRAIYFTHLKLSVPLIGLLFCGDASAYAYILESLKHYPAQMAVADKMRELKLANVRVLNVLGGAMAINYGERAA